VRAIIRQSGMTEEEFKSLRRAAPWIIATIPLVLGLTLALGQVALVPKWTSFFWLWVRNDLLFTCIARSSAAGPDVAGLGGGRQRP
jgi:hypothetical protein